MFGSVNAKPHALDHAIALLMQAATIGACYDVEAWRSNGCFATAACCDRRAV